MRSVPQMPKHRPPEKQTKILPLLNIFTFFVINRRLKHRRKYYLLTLLCFFPKKLFLKKIGIHRVFILHLQKKSRTLQPHPPQKTSLFLPKHFFIVYLISNIIIAPFCTNGIKCSHYHTDFSL